MKLDLRFNITRKLTLLLVLLATVLLAAVGALSVYNGYLALRAAAVSELLATAIEKQAALDVWINERQADLAALAATPHMLDDLASRSAAPASPDGAAASAGLGQAVHDHLVADLQGWTGANQAFLALTVIEPEHGQVLASTDPGEEGTFREDRAYFIAGKAGPTVQNPQYTVQGLTMFVAAPLRSADGRLLGVLAGRVNPAEMNAIIARRTGLRQTADAYLVNTSNLLVTQPRFIADPAVLQRGIRTEAAERCLARNSGVITADDYRGLPTISVYRWLPKTELCLIAEMGQAEAFAPSRAFGMTILLIAGLALLATSALAVALARSITRPVHQLVRGAQEIGKGNLEYRIEAQANDEIGQLATAFNEMAANLRATVGENIRLYQEARAWATELEQRVAEQTESIRASEAELRAIFAAMTDVILVLDCDGRYLEIAPTNPTLLYKPPAELIGKTLREVMPAEQADFFLEHIRRALETAQTINVEYSLPIGDHETWFAGTVSPMQADSVIWVARDITERKQAEAVLQASEENFRNLAENTLDGILIAGVNGRHVYANRHAVQLLRYSPEELLQTTQKDLADPAAYPMLQQRLQDRIAGRPLPTVYETIIRRKDGTSFSADVAGARTVWQGQACDLVFFRDITDRKRAEVALHESEDRYRTLAEASPDMIFVIGRDDRVQYVNSFAARQFKNSAADIIGRHQTEIFPSQVASRQAEGLHAVMQTGKAVLSESHVSFPDHERWLSTWLVPMVDAAGQVSAVMGISRDITEAKRAEEQLASTAADLARSNTELERFAYVASHDLQEPLRMVTSYLQLIERRYGDRLDGDAREFMGYAVDGANRMKALINDLLAYSRVGTRGKPFGAVDCETSLAQATANLQVAIAEHAAVVTHDPLPAVTGDAGQLTQLLQNLIGNAIKFHGAEPPRIHVSARQTFEVSETSKVWEFSVRDNGIGIAAQYFDRIFTIFQRLHTRDEYSGTGIGLAISKRIVERHGGRIWVESTPGQGATFWFTIPA